MTSGQRLPAGRTLSTLPSTLWLFITAAIFLLWIAGLLSLQVDAYDDSSLLVGARLVREGGLPYRDFYTIYGPLGYTLLAPLLARGRNLGLVLRFSQAVSLGVVIALVAAMTRRTKGDGPRALAAAGVPVAVLAVSAAFCFGSFLGLFFCFTSLLLYILSRTAQSRGGAIVTAVAGGLAWTASALIRPIFAVYSGGAMAAFLLVENAGRSSGVRSASRALLFFGAAALSLPALWLLLYPGIAPGLTLQASIFTPGRLFGSGERFLSPRFLLSHSGNWLATLGAIAAGGVLAAATLAWALSASSAATRRLVLIGALCGAAVTTLLVFAVSPAGVAFLATILIFLLGITAVVRMRHDLRASAPFSAAALLGLASCAFTHYFWSRSDRTHLAPAFALAGMAAVLAWPRLRRGHRAGVLAFFGFLVIPLPLLPLRAFRLPAWPAWPAAAAPYDAAAAVRFADRLSDPRSRFVAVASNHALTSANPVVLFLLSSRLPYTRWYQYDPGVQSSKSVQEEMRRELERSGSRAAVVWNTAYYVFEPRVADLNQRTDFDDLFDRLYPIRAARFGQYEVRLRAETRER